MSSFDGVSFGERGDGTTFPTWSVSGTVVVKKIPGSDDNVVQVIGTKRPRVALVAKCTAAQLASLRSKIGVTGSLVFSFETTTATLESVTDPNEQGARHDVYFATLNFIRSDPTFTTPSTSWLTQSGEPWLTQSGEFWINQ